jgi:hypothetical protein
MSYNLHRILNNLNYDTHTRELSFINSNGEHKIPSDNTIKIYSKDDSNIYKLDDNGTETILVGGDSTKTQNIQSATVDNTVMSGILEVPNIRANVLSDTTTQESNINMFNGGIFISSSNLSFNDRPILYSPYNGTIESTSFKKTGSTNDDILLGDGTTQLLSTQTNRITSLEQKTGTQTDRIE